MAHFSYSFITAMLHSIWQAAGLLAFYGLLFLANPGSTPLFKRNLLYCLAGFQLLLSVFTFALIYNEASTAFTQGVYFALQPYLQGSWIENNASFIFLLYALAFLAFTGRSFFSWSLFKRRYKQSVSKPSIDIRLFAQKKALHFGIRKKISIWCSNAVSTPMTFGFWKPVILLPLALVNRLSLEDTETLIIHELTHIRHHDYLLNWLLVTMQNVFFFNPFIHIIAREIRKEREKNCDVQVLMFSYSDVRYAETLLKTAQQAQCPHTFQLAAVKNTNQLLKRIYFFSDKNNLHFSSNRSILSAGGLLAILVMNMALAVIFIQKQDTITGIHRPIRFVASKISTPAGIEAQKTIFSGPATAKVSVTRKPVRLRPEPVKLSRKSQQEKQDGMGITADVVAENQPAYPLMQVSHTQPVAVEGKQITIHDESTDGKKTTAVYEAVLLNGEWKLQPVWMITESKSADSTKQHNKDSVIRIYPVVQ